MIGDVQDEGGRTTACEVAEQGGAATYRVCDVGRFADVQALVDATVAEYGRLDVLVNKGARWRRGSVTEVSPEDWEYGRSAILDATYYGCKAAIPHMIDSGVGARNYSSPRPTRMALPSSLTG